MLLNIHTAALYVKGSQKKYKAPCNLKAGFLPIKATILDKIKWNIKSPSPQIKGEAERKEGDIGGTQYRNTVRKNDKYRNTASKIV